MSKPTAVQFYAVQADGTLYAVHSESPKSAVVAMNYTATSWATPNRRMFFKFALRFNDLAKARAASEELTALRRAHQDAEKALGKANRQIREDAIARLAAQGG